MKRLSITLTLMLFCVSPMLHMQEMANPPTQQALTLQDYDTQIAQAKQDIARYNSLATLYGRQAQLVEFNDFDGYRDASAMRARCLSIAKDLGEHLTALEQQRAAFAKQGTAPEKK